MLLLLFGLVTVLCFLASGPMEMQGVDPLLVAGGNLLLFTVTLLVFVLLRRSLRAGRPQTFVRAMYVGFMVKFFTVALAAFIYILLTRKQVNVRGLATCAALYILYTVIETRALLRLLKRPYHAEAGSTR
jgi:threonine/homoserine/homoserine lactone efflux protein